MLITSEVLDFIGQRRRSANEQQQQLLENPNPSQIFFTTHAAIYNTFYTQRHLISRMRLRHFRAEAEAAWLAAVA